MEEYISKHNLKDVYLTGFKNQSEVGKYFAVADIFVLPSGAGETWGLVVNEAMNFALPIITSDLVGSSDDLIKESENGFVYNCNDIDALSNYISHLINDELLQKDFGIKSLEMIFKYSFKNIIYNLKTIN